MPEAKTVRAAIIQSGSILFDTPATIEKAAALTRDAAGQGAQLVVFPEAFIGGYPKGQDFGVKLGSRTPEGRDFFRQYFDSAIDNFEPLASIAAENKVHLVIGVVERSGGTLYCTVLFFSPDGALLGKHRKVMPTAMERVVWGFGDGSTLTVAETPLGRIGAVICWENYMPLLRSAMYAKGVELYCAPTVDDRETWLSTMRHIAAEGRCFVLSACQHVPGLIRGGSCVIGPLGNVIVAPVFDQDATHIVDLDVDDLARGKFDLDVVGHYARPDIFELRVNGKPQNPVTFNG